MCNSILFQYLDDTVIPIYQDFLKRQLSVVYLEKEQRDAITMYAFIILNKKILFPDEEVDMNANHLIFDHIHKSILKKSTYKLNVYKIRC